MRSSIDSVIASNAADCGRGQQVADGENSRAVLPGVASLQVFCHSRNYRMIGYSETVRSQTTSTTKRSSVKTGFRKVQKLNFRKCNNQLIQIAPAVIFGNFLPKNRMSSPKTT
jgi:hypothetical protein